MWEHLTVNNVYMNCKHLDSVLLPVLAGRAQQLQQLKSRYNTILCCMHWENQKGQERLDGIIYYGTCDILE